MTDPVIAFAAFRCHVLIAHDVVGSILFDRPTWAGLELDPDGVTYRRHGRPVLRVTKIGTPTRATVTVRSLADDVWIQEPGLTVATAGRGRWRGYGKRGQWVPTTRGVDGWLRVTERDADRSTVHFSRSSGPRFCSGVEYRPDSVPGGRWRFASDGGFARFLDLPVAVVPFTGCQVFGEPWTVAGIFVPAWEPLRRWELAGHPAGHWPGDPVTVHPESDWMHFLGAPGGAGAVVTAHGNTAPPGRNDRLHRPNSWRRLPLESTLVQSVSARRLS